MKNMRILGIVLLLVFSICGTTPVHASSRYSVGIYYVYTGVFDSNWENVVDQGMGFAIPRLNSFFAQYGIQWNYVKLESVRIDYNLVGDQYGNLPSGLYKTVPLIYEAHPEVMADYEQYDVFIFLYGGDFGGAYSYDYQSPIYASMGMFTQESQTLTLIEHEILHTFGLRDHNWPHTKPIYNDCIMGNLNLGEIKLCSESQIEYDTGGLVKEPFQSLVPNAPPDDHPDNGDDGGIIRPYTKDYTVELILLGALIMFFLIRSPLR